MSDLRADITAAINRASAENGSDTPDYILARFLEASLVAFDVAVRDRDEWYGFKTWANEIPIDPATPCQTCSGSGAIPEPDDPDHPEAGVHPIHCPDCDGAVCATCSGRGVWMDEPCADCRGTA